MNSVPDKVNEILGQYFDILESKLPDFLEAFYIYGSVSIGAFDYGFSDVDFLAVVERKVQEKDITSKVGAGEYSLRTVPEKWHKIINESMRLRKSNKRSFYKSLLKRRNDALEYIDYIIQESNKLFEGELR